MKTKHVLAFLVLFAVLGLAWFSNHQPSRDPLTSGLFLAAMTRNEQLARDEVARGCDVNVRADWNVTPLHFAACYNASGVARVLIENGADVNAHDNDGLTPLHEAARFGSAGVVKLLLERGVRNVDAVSNMGLTPLHMAAMNGCTEVARLLLSYGADPLRESYEGLLPADLARSNQHYGTEAVLVEHMLERLKWLRLPQRNTVVCEKQSPFKKGKGHEKRHVVSQPCEPESRPEV